ncbi:RNA helicase [Panaeolus papilionaceus]|nr:RNA helicase [Panaeolus papilionaceus]
MTCPNVLANGACTLDSCPYEHHVITCDSCNFIFPNFFLYQRHLTTKQHLNKLEKKITLYHCPLCTVNVSGKWEQWEQHINGARHRTKAAMEGVSADVEPEEPRSTSSSTFCDLCKIPINPRFFERHVAGAKHQSRVTFSRYASALEESEADKNDVVIEGNFDFQCVESDVAASGVRRTGVMKTNNPLCKITLIEAKLTSEHKPFGSSPGFTVEKATSLATRKFSYYAPLEFTISFEQRFVGRYQDRIELIFEDAAFKKRFVITKPLKAVVGDQALHNELAPKQAYKPRQATVRAPIRDVIPGIKPPSQTSIKYVAPLPKAEVPQYLKNILDGTEKSSAKVADKIRKIVLPHQLNVDSYGRFFKLLLWIEEFRMEGDLARYDILGAQLTRHNQYYYLEVPGLAEKRPSVLLGDRILVQEQGSSDGKWYEGHVHVVRQHEVGLRFHTTFDRYAAGRRFHIRFKLNRTPIKRQHQAMDSLFTEDRILFPDVQHLDLLQSQMMKRVSLRVFNPLIAKNEPQVQAVRAMLTMPPGSLPLIIFGPPGTGKTITIIEGIKQILSSNPNARILACAPSNSAADIIANRLMDFLEPDEMFRFYTPSRMKSQVPLKLLPYAYVSYDGHFSIPPISRVRRFRIIISTSISSSFTAGIGMSRGHFTHIFMDEAGQATEPEAFVSIKMMADSNTNVVLSGDPKQLGPVIRSGVARALGLEQSYLERLMKSDAYDLKNGARSMSVIKLTKNFRSHEAILRFPNERFYDDELTPHGDAQLINTYLKSSYLPSSSFPIVFHSVSGKDDREASSPSFFNIDEVIQIKSYVRRLKEDRRYRTTDADIGVIAPYHAQVMKLRSALRNLADDVKVGSVEEFQGQERKVIMISTVRSSKEFIEYDLLHTLGFVANPRRFNVAVTRAQALLIVVGDPQVLSLDPLWRSFLNYVYLNGGWTGPDITWDPTEPVEEAGGYDRAIREAAGLDMNEFSKRMEEATMAGVEDLDANVDRPWRDVE